MPEKPETCGHHDVYVEHIRDYLPRPSNGNRIFSIGVICRECGARLKGQVVQQ